MLGSSAYRPLSASFICGSVCTRVWAGCQLDGASRDVLRLPMDTYAVQIMLLAKQMAYLVLDGAPGALAAGTTLGRTLLDAVAVGCVCIQPEGESGDVAVMVTWRNHRARVAALLGTLRVSAAIVTLRHRAN